VSIVGRAFDRWREVRDEFELYRMAQFEAAEHATRGNLLSAEARARGIDAWSLFIGPHARAQRWASEELREWWREHGRLTFAEFEEQAA